VIVTIFTESCETLFEDLEGELRGFVSGHGFVEANQFLVFASFLGHQGFGFVGRSFKILGLVHKEKSLKRSVGPLAAGDTSITAWGIKDGHLRWREAPLPKSVYRSARVCGSGVCLKGVWVRRRECDHLPDASGLWRFDRTTAHFAVQNSCNCEELVANNFGVKPGARSTGKKAVLGIGFKVDLKWRRRIVGKFE
jgi:hypothetical protein